VVEAISWWDKLTENSWPIKKASVMHCLCQEAYLYESSRSELDVLKLFWICTAASSEIFKAPLKNKVRVKFSDGWKKRMQEYGEQLKPLMDKPGFQRQAREIGLVLIENDKPVEENESFRGKVDGKEIGDIRVSGIDRGYVEMSFTSASAAASEPAEASAAGSAFAVSTD
jgi:hypothetical protein